jgi:lipopolysaccharide transport system ATP-binding protein
MSHPIIEVEHLSKRYRLGVIGARSLRDEVRSFWQNRLGAIGEESSSSDEIWALRDVSFAVHPGEIVGIIGRNGAGKSTLLKILSRITEPTSGRAILRGKVASLLEVGTGFHPELTGRENVFLNGAILGMTRREIARKLDDIVAFADVSAFLDTPVKRYSSGMQLRLAFSVAAFLSAPILLVDETISVGDFGFQNQALRQIRKLADEGRSILLVSHNLYAVGELADRVLLLSSGSIECLATPDAAIRAYLGKAANPSAVAPASPDASYELTVSDCRVQGTPRGQQPHLSCDDAISISFHIQASSIISGLYGCLEIQNAHGTTVLVSDTFDCPPNVLETIDSGSRTVTIEIPPRLLAAGTYTIDLSFGNRAVLDKRRIHQPGVIGTFLVQDFRSMRQHQRAGYFSTLLTWRVD